MVFFHKVLQKRMTSIKKTNSYSNTKAIVCYRFVLSKPVQKAPRNFKLDIEELRALKLQMDNERLHAQ